MLNCTKMTKMSLSGYLTCTESSLNPNPAIRYQRKIFRLPIGLLYAPCPMRSARNPITEDREPKSRLHFQLRPDTSSFRLRSASYAGTSRRGTQKTEFRLGIWECRLRIEWICQHLNSQPHLATRNPHRATRIPHRVTRYP